MSNKKTINFLVAGQKLQASNRSIQIAKKLQKFCT